MIISEKYEYIIKHVIKYTIKYIIKNIIYNRIYNKILYFVYDLYKFLKVIY